jgi:hypothetical protein
MDAIMGTIRKASPALLAAVTVVAVVLLLALLSRSTGGGSGTYNSQFKGTLKNLISQSNRWSTIAQQDQNLVVALMHVNYALGFLKASRRLASDEDIQKITGTNVVELHFIMENQQADLIQQISTACPALGLDGVVALNAGWTG